MRPPVKDFTYAKIMAVLVRKRKEARGRGRSKA